MKEPEGQHIVKVQGVGDMMCHGLVCAQCSKSPNVVNFMAEALDDHGLKEEATQFRGWLYSMSVFNH